MLRPAASFIGVTLNDLLPQYMHTETFGNLIAPPSSHRKNRKRTAASARVLITEDARMRRPRLVSCWPAAKQIMRTSYDKVSWNLASLIERALPLFRDGLELYAWLQGIMRASHHAIEAFDALCILD